MYSSDSGGTVRVGGIRVENAGWNGSGVRVKRFLGYEEVKGKGKPGEGWMEGSSTGKRGVRGAKGGDAVWKGSSRVKKGEFGEKTVREVHVRN